MASRGGIGRRIRIDVIDSSLLFDEIPDERLILLDLLFRHSAHA